MFTAIAAGDAMPIPAESLFDTTLASFAAMESLRTGEPVAVDSRIVDARIIDATETGFEDDGAE